MFSARTLTNRNTAARGRCCSRCRLPNAKSFTDGNPLRHQKIYRPRLSIRCLVYAVCSSGAGGLFGTAQSFSGRAYDDVPCSRKSGNAANGICDNRKSVWPLQNGIVRKPGWTRWTFVPAAMECWWSQETRYAQKHWH